MSLLMKHLLVKVRERSSISWLITCLLCFDVSCQTAEEIDQLTVDEDLNDVERAVYLLRCVCMCSHLMSPDPQEEPWLDVERDTGERTLSPCDFSVGQEVQRASVISNLPNLVRQNPAETFRRVVPKVRVSVGQRGSGVRSLRSELTASLWGVQELLKGAGTEIQLSAATSFLTILQDDIILIHTHTYSILKTVLLHLNHRDTGNHT